MHDGSTTLSTAFAGISRCFKILNFQNLQFLTTRHPMVGRDLDGGSR
jgi:hypothetical protein